MRQTEIMDGASTSVQDRSSAGLSRDADAFGSSGIGRDVRHVNGLGKDILPGIRARETQAPVLDRRTTSKSSIASFRSALPKDRTPEVEREFSEFFRSGELVDWNTWDLAEPSNFVVHSPWTCNGSDVCKMHMRAASLSDEQLPDRGDIQSTAVKRLVQVRNHLLCSTAGSTDSSIEDSLFSTASQASYLREEDVREKLKSFGCSCIECHHMLALHNAGMLEPEKCIHDGCDQILEDTQDWLDHVMSRHHVSSRQQTGAAASPAWSDYDSSTTHYFGEHW